MFSFINKKDNDEFEYQRKLFEELEIGDIFWARMTLNEEQENRIEESHKKRPFLMIGKDDDIYALALTTKFYPNGHYPLTEKKYQKLKKDSYIDFREVNIIPKKNLESFSFKIDGEDLNKVIKLYNLTKEKGEHSLKVNYKTRYSLGDLINDNGKQYLIYKIENDKIFAIRVHFSSNETDLRINGVYFSTNFMVRIFEDNNFKLDGICNNLLFEKIGKTINKKIPFLTEANLEAKEEDLNNCLKLIRFKYLDDDNYLSVTLNTITFSATKAYGTLNLNSKNVIEVPFIEYEVIRDLDKVEKRNLILNTKEIMLQKENVNIGFVLKKYKDEIGDIDIYNKGDIFNYKGNIYILYKIENEILYTIKLKECDNGRIVINDNNYDLSNVKRKFTINDAFNYVNYFNIDSLIHEVNEIDKNGTFIDFGTIININGEILIAIYVNGNEVWGISDWDNPLLRKLKVDNYSIISDISIKNLKKIKELAPKFNNALPDEIKFEDNEIKFGDIIKFNDEKIVNLIILKKSGNKFYGIKNLENPEVYKYKLYKNRYSVIGKVDDRLLVKLKKIADQNIEKLNEESNFRKGM